MNDFSEIENELKKLRPMQPSPVLSERIEEQLDCRPSVSDGDPTHWRWQEGCFDRLLRSNELLSEKWEYLRQNPIRAGLAVDPDESLSISIL